MKKKNEKLLRENEKLKNEKNNLRKLNLKNDSKFSLMFRDGSTSLLSNSNFSSLNPSGRNNNYQSQMFKILGDIDSSGSKVDTEASTNSKGNKKNDKDEKKNK